MLHRQDYPLFVCLEQDRSLLLLFNPIVTCRLSANCLLFQPASSRLDFLRCPSLLCLLRWGLPRLPFLQVGLRARLNGLNGVIGWAGGKRVGRFGIRIKMFVLKVEVLQPGGILLIADPFAWILFGLKFVHGN